MRPTITGKHNESWLVDYSAARARAIAWLGDRYLLAKPINARGTTVERKSGGRLVHTEPR